MKNTGLFIKPSFESLVPYRFRQMAVLLMDFYVLLFFVIVFAKDLELWLQYVACVKKGVVGMLDGFDFKMKKMEWIHFSLVENNKLRLRSLDCSCRSITHIGQNKQFWELISFRIVWNYSGFLLVVKVNCVVDYNDIHMCYKTLFSFVYLF